MGLWDKISGMLDSVFGESEPGGFMDWVKNPEWRKHAAKDLEEWNKFDPDQVADSEIPKLVAELFPRESRWDAFRKLDQLGERAIPSLIEALNDRKITLTADDRQRFDPVGSPLDRISALLTPHSVTRIHQRAFQLSQFDRKFVRGNGIAMLTSTGLDQYSEHILGFLESDQDRSDAIRGLTYAIQNSKMEPALRKKLFRSIGTRILDRQQNSDRHELVLFLNIGARSADRVLQDSKIFSTDNPDLGKILDAYVEVKRPIPDEVMLELIETTTKNYERYRHKYPQKKTRYRKKKMAGQTSPDRPTIDWQRILISCIKCYGISATPERETFFEKMSRHSDENIAAVSTKALCKLRRLDANLVYDLFETEHDINLLSIEQQNVLGVLLSDGEICNGGFHQFFVNSSGECWEVAVRGMEAIGQKTKAQMVRDAGLLFGPSGPPVDHDERHSALARFNPKQDEWLEQLNSEYYKDDTHIDLHVSRYLLANPVAFRLPK